MTRVPLPSFVLPLSSLFLISISYSSANPPGVLNQQGRISISGVNHDGSGYFKFAFVDAAGTTSYWSNDGTSGGGGGEPTSAVEVTVTHGHYAVPLGDTTVHANMTNAIPASVFADHDDVRLRTWFAMVAGGPFEQLSPDQRVTSAGYALSASRAQSVAELAITEAMLADGSVTTAKLAPGAVNTTILAPGAAGENIDTAGSMGIGLDGLSTLAAVHLDGDVGFPDPVLRARLVDGSLGFNALAGATSVHVSGTTAYVASLDDNSLTIIDVSTPSGPILLAEVVDGTGGFNALAEANCVYVSGTTAYVTSGADNALTIIDVTDPTAPSLLAEVVDGSGGFNALAFANGVHVSGTTAFVTAGNDNALTIIDVTNPSAPTLLAEVVDGVGGYIGLGGAASVDVSGNIAFVTAYNDDALSIIDVTTPSAPTLLAEIFNGFDGFAVMNGPRTVQVEGTTAYVSSSLEDSLTIIDVSTPAAPALLAQIRNGYNGFYGLTGLNSVCVSGTTAYAAATLEQTLAIIDVSDPSAPRPLALIEKGAIGNYPTAIAVSGSTGYIVSQTAHSLSIIDLDWTTRVDLATAHRVGIGTTQPDAMLDVRGDAYISGSLRDSRGSPGGNGQMLMSTLYGTSWETLADNDATNELQTLGLAGDNLSLSPSGGTVSLAPYLRSDTDDTFTGDTLTIDGNLTANNTLRVNNSLIYFRNGTKFLYYDPTYTHFEMSDDLALSGSIQTGHLDSGIPYNRLGTHYTTNGLNDSSDLLVTDDLEVDGSLYADGYIQVGTANGLDDDSILFDGDGSLEAFSWDESANSFTLSNDLAVTGDLSANAISGNVFQVGTNIGTNDDSIYFDVGSAERLYWDDSQTSFRFSDDLRTDGNVYAGGNLYVGDNSSVNDDTIYFDALQWLRWDESAGWFQFSNEVMIDGNIYAGGDLQVGSASGTDDDYLHFDDGSEFLVWNNFEGRFELSNDLKIDGQLFVNNQIVWGDTSSGTFGQPALQLRSHQSLVFMMDADDSSNNTDQFEWYEDGATLAANKLMELQYDGDLRIRGVLSQSIAFDIAESFYMAEPLEPGELVRVDPARSNGVRRSSGTDDETILGVVSANPGFLLGGAGFDEATLEVWGPAIRKRFREESARLTAEVLARDPELTGNTSLHQQRVMEQFFNRHFAKIALAGRVPVKVNTRFGAIQPGDRLTASPLPGVAMKATRAGPTIGVALEGLAAGEGSVLTFIQSGWHEGAQTTENLVQRMAEELRARDAMIQSLEERLTALENQNRPVVVTSQAN